MAKTVRVLRSTDASAPVLTGTTGSLIALLDACLVNGYGSSTPLGWTKPYSGTNLAAYRMSTVEGSGAYLRVDDSLTSTNAVYTRLAGYTTMTAISTGSDMFPVMANYMGLRKSNSADSVARPWVVIGDEARFYLLIQNGDSAGATIWDCSFFGDIESYIANDAYKAMLVCRYSTSGTFPTYTDNQIHYMQHYTWNSVSSRQMARNHAGAATPIYVGAHTDSFKCGASNYNAWYAGAGGYLAYPNVAGNSLFMAPVWIHQSTTTPYVVRGHQPGMWCPGHNRPLANNETFTGSGALAGKTFEAFHLHSSGEIILETSNTWG